MSNDGRAVQYLVSRASSASEAKINAHVTQWPE